jgi:hypothetical protein
MLSNIDSATVLVDGVPVGKTPLTVDTLAPGRHVLRIVHPEQANWRINEISDSILVASGENRTLRYTFKPCYVVMSVPFGADVFLGDSLLGTTPLQVSSAALPLSRDTARSHPLVTIRKPGHETAEMSLMDAQRGLLSVELRKTLENVPEAATIFKYEERKGPSRLPLYISGATTIVSGVAAAYFKTRADDRYALYEATGDPALLRETHRLDTASAISLAVTQLSFILFSYFILSE